VDVTVNGVSSSCVHVFHRETHHISGAAVKMAEDRGIPLSSLSVADLQSIHPLFADDVVKVRLTGWQ
jgi:argininosuccinate lyase